MWRRMNREDLLKSNPLLGGSESRGHLLWRVYEGYELVPLENEDDYFVQVAGRGTEHEASFLHMYEPITDTPYLFLEFARLVESKSPETALHDFIHKHGLLGLSPQLGIYDDSSLAGASPQTFNDYKGGTRDRLENIWAYAWEANESLLLYEAAISGNREKLEQALFSYGDAEWIKDRRRLLKDGAAISGASWVEVLTNAALFQLVEFAHGPLVTSCYPVISYPQLYSPIPEDGAPPMKPDDFSRGWAARNLWGAMGLQFYWLVTSSGQLDRCKYCGRVISYAPPVPGGRLVKDRKPRSDKSFCNSRCRQNYHYHNRQKPKRSDEKS